jgi:elongation factor 1-beta
VAEVLVTLTLMPTEAGIDLSSLKEGIRSVKEGRFNGVAEEPIAFGLVALNSSFVVEDEAGATEALESSLSALEGVRGVEVIQVTRLL